MKNLVIVESPAKANTINRYLGADFEVIASFGHVRDLPKSRLGVDTEHDFVPEYIIPIRSRKVITLIKSKAQQADEIYLATDLDREGEAIAWHIIEACGLKSQSPKLKSQNVRRITFSEITKSAIREAIKNPRAIDLALVGAQQARRILDRLVGYNLSPLLWKKVLKGLSAGRVQSVAVRLVVDREREIQNFKPAEFWSLEATLEKPSDQPRFVAKLIKFGDLKVEKDTLKTKKASEDIKQALEKAVYQVSGLKTTETRRQPYPPFTTSTLQQEAGGRLRFPVKLTMRLAQNLYEAGYITYMRTDSVNLSGLAVGVIRKTIENLYGKNYVEDYVRKYQARGKVQEAHEAIRPAYPSKTPDDLRSKLEPREFKLYDMIWRRALATQMSTAVFDTASVEITAGKGIFSASGSKLKFDGWLKVYPQKLTQFELPSLEKGDKLKLIELNARQHFTEPPARYSEATLVRALEEKGIGRPSTYAPILSVIGERGYVGKERGRLFPQEIGLIVNDLLVEHFPDIVDYNFTAKLEDELDEVAAGKLNINKLLSEFWQPFAKRLSEKTETIEKHSLIEETERTCPQCKKKLVIRRSRFGKFYACAGFPACKFTEPFLTEKDQAVKNQAEAAAEDRQCPKCKEPLVARRGKYGYFIGCSGYPKCNFLEKIVNNANLKSQISK